MVLGHSDHEVSVTSTVVNRGSAEAARAEELRSVLVDRLCGDGVVRSAAVEAALRRVPRHLFVPGTSLEEAYADEAVYTKHDPDTGASISAASQPRIVAMMLEQLQAAPGMRVLELGAGTGYNAALLAALVGPEGRVTTVDVDDDLVAGAQDHLAAAGVANVEAVLGDGALGHPDSAPYDRIIATVGAYEVPTAWLEQLAPGGRLVVPLRLSGAVSRSIVFERAEYGWTSRGSELAVFMPLRGIGDDARRVIDLTGDGQVTLQTHKDNTDADADGLAGVLGAGRCEAWSGVCFVPRESFEWLYLWLSCRLANPLMRMNVEPAARDSGLVAPMFPTTAMATTRGGDLAYLTIRAAEPGPDSARRYEVGVIGHGPGAEELAYQVVEEVRVWDRDHRNHQARFELPEVPVVSDPEAGRYVLDRPHHPVTVIWE